MKKKIFIILCLIIMVISNINAFSKSNNKDYDAIELGPGIGPIHFLGLTGDSYSCLLSDYLYATHQIRPKSYSVPGTTIEENYNSIINCIQDKNNKYIILSIGVNDHVKQTDPLVFKNTLKSIINVAKAENKYLFMHTYMKYPLHEKYNKKYTCKQYDYAIQDLALANKNVDYIKMSDVNDVYCQDEDGIHYNSNFYKAFMDRISPKIIELFNQIK